jgi:hypothetical protein
MLYKKNGTKKKVLTEQLSKAFTYSPVSVSGFFNFFNMQFMTFYIKDIFQYAHQNIVPVTI